MIYIRRALRALVSSTGSAISPWISTRDNSFLFTASTSSEPIAVEHNKEYLNLKKELKEAILYSDLEDRGFEITEKKIQTEPYGPTTITYIVVITKRNYKKGRRK